MQRLRMVHEIDRQDLSLFSSSLPDLPEQHIPRPSLVTQISATFSPTGRIVIVEGQSGSGKTVLLSEFVRTFPTQCISFFVGTDFWTSDPNYFLFECCNQMKHMDKKTRNVDLGDVSLDSLQRYFGKLYRMLSKRAIETGKPFYFVIDSLDRVPPSLGQKTILDFLPKDLLDGVYLLGSCVEETDLDFQYQRLPIVMFSESETEQFFPELTYEYVAQIHSASRGMPSYLNILKRELNTTDADNLVADLPGALPMLYDRVWERIEQDSLFKKVVSVICLIGGALTAESLSVILGEPACEIVESVAAGRNFVNLNEETGEMTIEDSFKKYALEKLGKILSETTFELIQFYESGTASGEARIHLPDLYCRANDYEKLRALITPSFLGDTLRDAKDIAAIRRAIGILVPKAKEEEDWETLIFCSLGNCLIGELARDKCVIAGKLDALLALGKHEEAILLAQQAYWPVDRFLYLSKVCKNLFQQGLSVSSEMAAALEDTFYQVTITQVPEVRDKLLNATSLLFAPVPELALKILERMKSEGDASVSEGHLMDLFIGRVLVENEVMDDNLYDYIADEEFRGFTRIAAALVGHINASQVMEEVGKIGDASAKAFFLVSWCRMNKNNPELHVVFEYTLDYLSQTTDYSPSLRQLRHLAEVADVQNQVLFYKLDSLKSMVLVSPVEEDVRFELAMAKGEANWNSDAALSRLIEVYYYTMELPNPVDRCLGLIFLKMHLEKEGGLDPGAIQEVSDDLELSFEEVLEDSADQFRVLRSFFGAVARYDEVSAVKYAARLNTEKRRIEALEQILRMYAAFSETVDIGFILSTLQLISDKMKRDLIMTNTLRALSQNRNFAGENQNKDLLNYIFHMDVPRQRAYSAAFYLVSSELVAEQISQLEEILLSSLAEFDDQRTRIESSFSICSTIAGKHEKIANNIYNMTLDDELSLVYSERLGVVYFWFCALLLRTVADENRGSIDLDRVRDLTEMASHQILSNQQRADLLSLLGVILVPSNKSYVDIVGKKGLSLLDSIGDSVERANFLITFAPVLFEYERELLFEELEKYPSNVSELALFTTVKHLITGRAPMDPVDLDNHKCVLDVARIEQVIVAIGHLDTDYRIYMAIDVLVNAIINSQLDIERVYFHSAEKLVKIVDEKLPDSRNISHYGYKIVSLAKIGEMRKRLGRTKKLRPAAGEKWDGLIPTTNELARQALNVSNLPDRVFCMCSVARSALNETEAKQLLDDALDFAYEIRNDLDRLERLLMVAQTYFDLQYVEPARETVLAVILLIKDIDDDEMVEEFTERLVNIAHAIDPDFAASMSSKMDTTSAIVTAREASRRQTLRKQPNKLGQPGLTAKTDWLFLQDAEGLFSSYCANRAGIQSDKVIGDWIFHSFGKELEPNYYIASWFIENKTASTPKALTPQLGQLSESLAGLTHLVPNIGVGFCDEVAALGLGSLPHIVNSPTKIKTFKVGYENEVKEYLNHWLLENARDWVRIYDPYFSWNELWILKSIPVDTDVLIITSWAGQSTYSMDDAGTLQSRYTKSWHDLCDHTLLNTVVYIFGTAQRNSPMHDRYIVTDNGALSIGTSLNHMGNKDFAIQELEEPEQMRVRDEIIGRMILNPPTTYHGERLLRTVFSIG